MMKALNDLCDEVDTKSFNNIGIIKLFRTENLELKFFYEKIIKHSQKMNLDKGEIIKTFKKIIPEFYHVEKKYNLDQKM